MNVWKYVGAISTLGLMAILGVNSVAWSHAEHTKIQLETNPDKSQIFPFAAGSETPQTPVQFTVWAIGETGLPVKDAKIRLQIFTPAPTPWLTTDFPMVEGSKLLEIEVPAPTGTMQIQQMLPIRGNYRIEVEATPAIARQFNPIQGNFTLPVQENVAKYRNAAILIAILLAAGVGGGWLIGGQQTIRDGDLAPRRVQLLLSGAAVLAIAALIGVNVVNTGHGHDHASHPHIDTPAIQESQGLTLEILGGGEAIVGQPNLFTVQVQDKTTGIPVEDVRLKIKTVSLEDGWTMFAYEGIADEAGQLTWQQQFFDGAPHQTIVEVSPQPESPQQFQPFQVVQDIEVEAIEPPLVVQLITLFYFTLILLVGVAIGFKMRRSRKLTLRLD